MRNATQRSAWRLIDPGAVWRGRSDGQNTILLLFAMAVAVGLLVALGARQLTHHWEMGQPSPRAALSAGASELGYKLERQFQDDTERASLALEDVLAADAGAQRLWQNAETGNRGVVWASAESVGADGAVCRSLARRTAINGQFHNSTGIACRKGAVWEQKDGWRPE